MITTFFLILILINTVMLIGVIALIFTIKDDLYSIMSYIGNELNNMQSNILNKND